MKIFIDAADYDIVKQWAPTHLIDGITTNPSLLSKLANQNYKDVILNIAKIMAPRDVSVQITEADPKKAYTQALRIAALAENIVVKLPCCPEFVPIIDQLVGEGIRLNITLVFSATQALMMAKLGVAYVSLFIGRLEDIDSDGLSVISDTREIFSSHAYETQILAASIRSVHHVHEAALRGADIATVPPTILQKTLEHPLSFKGLNQFIHDWQSAGSPVFP